MQNLHQPIRLFSNVAILDAHYNSLNDTAIHEDRWSKISLVLQGKLLEEAAGKTEYAASGSLVLKPGDMLHKNCFGPGSSRVLSVAFRPGFLSRELENDIDDWQWFHRLPNALAAFQFGQQIREAQGEEAVLEALTELFSLLPNQAAICKDAPAWIHWVAEQIQDEYQHPLQTKLLAKDVGAHPVYLARVFRSVYKCSIKTFLQRRRVEQALQDISNSKKSLSQIALDHGFSDQSHLSRIFKRELHFSPGAFRKWAAQ